MILHMTETDSFFIREELVPMSDGVRLYTRCATPKGVEKCPTVFIRTPYEGANGGVPHGLASYGEGSAARRFIEHGYAVVLQHCRGKGDSEGLCIPYAKEERTDALETLDYIRALPTYNGEIFVTGGSYLATVHLSYLSAKPHDIKGACLEIQTDRLFFRNYRNGLNYKLNNIGWWSSMVSRKYPQCDLSAAFRLPYIEAAQRVFGEEVPAFTDTLIHNTPDEFWQRDEKWNVMETLEIPTLLVEGWYDFYVEGMTDMWRRMPEETKKRSAMLIGPYGHATSVGAKFEYPLPCGNLPPDYAVEWFDSIREGRPYLYAECGKVRYYSIGADAWREGEYPPGAPQSHRLYLGAQTLSEQPTRGVAIRYRYDPASLENPFRSFGIFRAHKAGSIESVLSFVGEPVGTAHSYFGSVRVHLTVSSDCEDTAFFVRLYLVEGEEAYNLTEALGGLTYLAGEYTPGTAVEIDLETPPIAFTLKEGMRLRVDIASETGNYLPHPNVKGHFAYVTEQRIATNTVYTEGSYLELPIEE